MSIDCPAADGIYLRANGSFVCWNSPGEFHALASAVGGELEGRDLVEEALQGPTLCKMRGDLRAHREPFDFCGSCSWGGSDGDWSRVDPETHRLRRIRTLQIEPSFLCNLDCPQCIPIGDRKSAAGPYHLDPRVFRKLIDDLVVHGIPVEAIQYGGFGEPMMSPHFPELVRYAADHLGCPQAADSNGNFPFRPELLDCGLDWFVLAFDGVDQESYVTYRRRGDFEKLRTFARDLLTAREARGGHGPRVAWKTVLFEWNSSNEQLETAVRMANELGVDRIRFVNTTTPGGISSANRFRRWAEIRELIERLRGESAVPIEYDDPDCFAGEKHRCHGFIDGAREEDEGLLLSGWILLDDGPADRMVVRTPEGTELEVRHHPRPDLVEAHPEIPDASGGGFTLRVPESARGSVDPCTLEVQLFRDDFERVSFLLEGTRAGVAPPTEPIRLRHGKRVRLAP